MLPLVGADQVRVRNDLERSRLQGVVEFAKTSLLASTEHSVELIGRICLAGDLVDIVVERLRVENGRLDRIILIVQLGEEVIPPQAKLPMGPAPTSIGGIVHSLAFVGGGSGRGSAVGIE